MPKCMEQGASGSHNGYKVSTHKTATSIDSRRQLQQATPMQVPKLFGVGGVLLGNVVAFGALCDMMLDIVVLQVVDLLLAMQSVPALS